MCTLWRMQTETGKKMGKSEQSISASVEACPGRARLLRVCYVLMPLCLWPLWTGAEITRFAYAVNAYDSSVSIFHIDGDAGSLRPVGHVPVKKFPGSAVAHPNGRFLYVSTQTGMVIHGFAVDPVTGRLTELAGSPFDPQVVSPFWLAMDPQGQYLYIAGRNSNAIAGMAVDQQNGKLANVPGSPYPGGFMPRSVAVAPDGKHVYMTSINDDAVNSYRIDRSNGSLAPLPTGIINAGDAPQFLTFAPDGNHAYVTSWTTKSLLSYRVNPETGLLEQELEYGLGEDISPFGLSYTPDGRYLYVASWFGGIVGFRRDTDKDRLVNLPGSPFSTYGVQPLQVFVEPRSRHAYVTNYGNNTLSHYRINADDGSLQVQETLHARAGPRAMAFVQGAAPVRYASRYLFALRGADNTLVSYDVDNSGATLRQRAQVKTGKQPVSVVVDPLNEFVLTTNQGDNSISVFRLDKQGALQAVPGSPFATGGKPAAVRIDYNGRYVYTVNEGSNNMSVYLLHRDSGKLEEAPDTAFFSKSP